MRCGCPLRNLVCCCAFAIALLPVLLVGGCGPIPFDAGFQSSADENILGTLVDDRGSFTFNLNPDTGNIQGIDADNGTITPPTDGQDLSIARDTGGNLTVSPEGASDVIVVVRGDPIVGDLLGVQLHFLDRVTGELEAGYPLDFELVGEGVDGVLNRASVDVEACYAVQLDAVAFSHRKVVVIDGVERGAGEGPAEKARRDALLMKQVFDVEFPLSLQVGRLLGMVLLVPLFYGFFMVYGLLFRGGRRDKLERYFDKDVESYWKIRNDKKRDLRFYERQF